MIFEINLLIQTFKTFCLFNNCLCMDWHISLPLLRKHPVDAHVTAFIITQQRQPSRVGIQAMLSLLSKTYMGVHDLTWFGEWASPPLDFGEKDNYVSTYRNYFNAEVIL